MRTAMLKRDFRLFVRCLITAAVLTAAFAAVCAAAAFSAFSGAGSGFTPVKTAVVDEENSPLSQLVINAAASSEYISQLMDISVCSEDKAMTGLQSGKYAAVILLPKGTVDGILSGQNTKGRIYLSSSAALHSETVAKAAAFGEVMLAAGQYGIFSAEQLIRENRLDAAFREEFLTKYNAILLLEALNAGSSYFDIHVTDYADTGMHTAAYYIVCWLCLLIVLLPMLFSRLYSADMTRPILCRLGGLGIKDSAFLLGKYLFPFLFIALLTLSVLAGAAMWIPLHLSVPALLLAVLGAGTAALLGGSIMIGAKNGVAVIAASSIAGLLLCGGLIPRQALPEEVLYLGALTPFGVVQNMLLPIFGGTLRLLPLFAAVIYTFGLLLLVKRRLMRIRIGGDVL